MSKLRLYIDETVDELVHKVSWPSWKDLQSSAIIVMIASAIIAMLVWVMDYVFGNNGGDAVWKGILGLIYDIIK